MSMCKRIQQVPLGVHTCRNFTGASALELLLLNATASGTPAKTLDYASMVQITNIKEQKMFFSPLNHIIIEYV